MIKLKTENFKTYNLNCIRPEGWLKKQLRIQADGLCGHLDEFWPDIKNSSWFGGDAEGWERVPYWLDGLIPLATQLQDKVLLKKVHQYMNYIIDHQHDDGWLGPKDFNVENLETKENYDIWGQFLILKVFVQYYDIGDKNKIQNLIENSLKKIDNYINFNPLFDWGQARWFEALIPIFWLYNKKPEKWLIDLAVKLEAQGFNWKNFFKRWPMKKPTEKGNWNFMSHIVNNTMAIKAYALWWKITGEDEDRETVDNIINQLLEYHGTAVETITGDECLAGKSPIRGTELCAVVEQMYSLENLIVILGDSKYADSLEKIAYNALPATFTPEMWAHQYDQQVNQVECSRNENRLWNTNGADANIFGLQPHFGCCTVNFVQGWPKFTSHLWMKTQDNGIVATVYAPSSLNTEINKTKISLTQETDYPFKDSVKIILKTPIPVQFSLHLRNPKWSKNTTIDINGKQQSYTTVNGFIKLNRLWKNETVINIKFKMEAKLLKRDKNSYFIQRGPLIYSLPISENKVRINKDDPLKELPHGDWEMYPTTKWNYALDLTEGIIEDKVKITEKEISEQPFSFKNSPVEMTLNGHEVPEWTTENGSALDISKLDISYSKDSKEITLIPYGCTNLRITEFPITKEDDK